MFVQIPPRKSHTVLALEHGHLEPKTSLREGVLPWALPQVVTPVTDAHDARVEDLQYSLTVATFSYVVWDGAPPYPTAVVTACSQR